MSKKHTNVRMNSKLHEWLTKQAAKESRTFTNYIEVILDNYRTEVINRQKDKATVNTSIKQMKATRWQNQ